MFRMFRNTKSRNISNRSKFSLRGRSLRYEAMEGRLVLSASGFAGNECAPEFDDVQMESQIPGGPFSPGSNINFTFNASAVVSDSGIGATPTDDILFILDPDIDANFRDNGSTPIGATLVANDPGNNDQWDFSWTPTDMQIGTYRLFIIATDDGGAGGANPAVPLSDVFAFTLEIDNKPVIDLNGDGENENAGIDFGPVTFTEGEGPVTVVDDDLSIPFAAGDMVASATVELTNPQAGDELALVLPAGSPLEIDPTSTSSRLVINVTAPATLVDKAEFVDALSELTFNNTSDDPGLVVRNISVTINDGLATSDPAMTSVNTIGTNDRPDLLQNATIANGTVGEAYSISFNATDPDSADRLVFQIQIGPDDADISPNAGQANAKNTIQVDRVGNGYAATVEFTPTQAQLDAGEVLLRISVTDTGQLADTEEYTIPIVNQIPTTVDDPETVPTIADDDFAVDENNAADIGNLFANDEDLDGDALSVEAATTTEGGASVADPTSFTTVKGALVTIDAAGNVNYDPNGMFDSLAAGAMDTDEFWYTVNDGRGGISPTAANVTVTIFGRNDAPRAITTSDDPNFTIPEFSVNEDDGVTPLDTAAILAAALDVDQGDILSITSAPADNADGAFSFTAQTSGAGSEVVSFDPLDDPALTGGQTKNVDVMVEVQDAAGLTGLIPIRIVVTGVSIAPVANNDDAVAAIDTSELINVVSNDNAGDVAIDPATVDLDPATAGQQTSFTVVGEGNFAVDAAGNVTFTPDAGFSGTSTVSYTVSDDNGVVSNAADISVRVNTPPMAVANATETGRDTTVSFNVTNNDTDSDGIIDPSTVDLNPSTPGIDFIIPVQDVGSYSVNAAGEVTFDPLPEFSGVSMISYTVQDNDGAVSNEATISVTVNDPPTADDDPTAPASFETNEDTLLSIAAPGILVNDSDDSDPVSINVAEFTYSDETKIADNTIIDEDGSALTVNADGSFDFTPGDSFQSLNTDSADATVTFTYKAEDDFDAPSNDATVSISVTGVNDAPTAAAVTADAMEDAGSVTGNFAGSDVDNADSSLTYEITSTLAAGQGTVQPGTAAGTFEYDPGDNFQDLGEGETATVTFDYKAIDAAFEESADATVTVTVTGVNDAPEVDAPSLATALGGTDDNGVIRVDLARGATLMVDLAMFTTDIDGDEAEIEFTRVTNNLPGQPFRSTNLPNLTQAGALDWTPDNDLPTGEYTIRFNAADADSDASMLDIVITVM